MMNNFTIVIGDEKIDITTKLNLNFNEMLAFVNDIVSMVVVEEEGLYLPELFDLAVRRATVEAYTDYKLPGEIDEIYDILYNSTLYDYLLAPFNFKHNEHLIDIEQHSAAVDASRKKVEFLVGKMTPETKLDELLKVAADTLTNLNATFSGVAMSSLTSALGKINDIDASDVVKVIINTELN